jgi:hypothetical protein
MLGAPAESFFVQPTAILKFTKMAPRSMKLVKLSATRRQSGGLSSMVLAFPLPSQPAGRRERPEGVI